MVNMDCFQEHFLVFQIFHKKKKKKKIRYVCEKTSLSQIWAVIQHNSKQKNVNYVKQPEQDHVQIIGLFAIYLEFTSLYHMCVLVINCPALCN